MMRWSRFSRRWSRKQRQTHAGWREKLPVLRTRRVRKTPPPNPPTVRPKLHLEAFSPALLGKVYRALVVGRVELAWREDTARFENVQTVLLHVPTPIDAAGIGMRSVTSGTRPVCVLVHIHLCTCACCLSVLSSRGL